MTANVEHSDETMKCVPSGNANLLSGVRIALVIGDFSLGGAERTALTDAKYLNEETGAAVCMVGMGKPGVVSDKCSALGIPWKSIPFNFERARTGKLVELVYFTVGLKRLAPDMILAYTHLPNVACGLAWRLCGSKSYIWGQHDEGLYFRMTIVERLASLLTPHFIAVSNSCAAFLTTKLGVPPERVSVVHNSVCLKPACLSGKEWRTKLGVKPDQFVVLMLATLSPLKDHDTLLRAWSILIQELAVDKTNPEPLLLIAGRDAGCASILAQQVCDLSLQTSVLFLGEVDNDDVSGLIASVNLGVLSSRSEGCGISLLECMALGLPVVGTNNPGIVEAVGPSNVQFLAALGDPVELAKRILLFMRSNELCTSAGNENHIRVETLFNPHVAGSQIAQLIAAQLSIPQGSDQGSGGRKC